MNISAGEKTKKIIPRKENKPIDLKSWRDTIIVLAIVVMIAAMGESFLKDKTILTKAVFGDISNVKDQHFIPMVKQEDQPPQQETPGYFQQENQPPPQSNSQPATNQSNKSGAIIEHVGEGPRSSGEIYQYKDKNGVLTFSDNAAAAPQSVEVETRSWRGQGGNETQITVEGNRIYIPVTITSSGRTWNVRLLLDTGASSTAIYANAVPGIQVKNMKRGNARLADGRQIPTVWGTVDDIAAGSARLRETEVTFIQQSGEKDHQGLLGMDFLKNFHYTLDLSRKIIRWN